MTGGPAAAGAVAPVAPVAVDVRGWGWRHGGRAAWALRGVDLHLDPGERVLLLGPSGGGKSTLLTALAGLLDPSSGGQGEGTITLDGRPAHRSRERAGLVMQDPEAALVMARSGDDVAFGLENRGVPTDEIWRRVDEALASVGFPYGRDQPTAALSGGEQQRLAIAGILALRPGLLLLDEVTANLDPDGAALVRAVLADVLTESGATAVVVEHRVEQVVGLVTRAVVLEPSGGVVEDGRPEEVFHRVGDRLAARGVWVPGRRPDVRRRAVTPTGPSLVRADATAFRYPATDRDALPPTDETLRAGEVLAVTGPNGSGKSTLALCLAGLLRPTGGSVTGEPAIDPPEPARPLWRWRGRDLVTRVGTVFQDPEHQFVASTVRAELMVGPRRAGASDAEAAARADELLAFVGLAERAGDAVDRLSGGMRRRLQIARALVNRPRMVLLDEPTTGLDPQARHVVWERLRALKRQGAALVLTTHYMDEAAQLCDRIVIMDGGRIVRAGTPAGLVAEEVGREVLELRLAPADIPGLLARLDGRARGHQVEGDLLLLFADDAEALHAEARATGIAMELQAARRAGLEDVFLALTGRSLRED
jgi:energy-coupling factor transporter ATP-binding protein EcfA2